jgi:hypothetical protein
MALIYRSPSNGVADIAVFQAGAQGLADLLVWVTPDQGLARGEDGVWCFVDSSGLATTRIWLTDQRGAADLAVFYVASRGLSGWRTSHALAGRL